MKIFVESLDKGIWDAIENDPFIPIFEKEGALLKNLGPNRLRLKIKRPSLIALPRIS